MEPGEEKEVKIVVEKRLATSFWDEERDSWIVEWGVYRVWVGNSCGCERYLEAGFRVDETFWWDGL